MNPNVFIVATWHLAANKLLILGEKKLCTRVLIFMSKNVHKNVLVCERGGVVYSLFLLCCSLQTSFRKVCAIVIFNVVFFQESSDRALFVSHQIKYDIYPHQCAKYIECMVLVTSQSQLDESCTFL